MANATLRQTWALMRKNLIINLRRQYFSTVIRAFIFPILFVAIVSFSRNILLPPSNYGVGSPEPILSLRDAVAAEGKKNKLMFVNNGLGGEVDQVISRLQNGLTNVGNVTVLTDPKSLREECQSNLNGVSPCFAAVVFESSPNTNGSTGNGTWKYLLRGDNDLNGLKVDAFKHDNPVQKSVNVSDPGWNSTDKYTQDFATSSAICGSGHCQTEWLYRSRFGRGGIHVHQLDQQGV